MVQRVLVDANILFSKTLMDWTFLLRLENPGMFQLHATEDILAETIKTMRERHPRYTGKYTRSRAELLRKNLDELIGDFPSGIPFSGTDEGDYHVHAAAVAGEADVILTCNAPEDITTEPDAEPYEIQTPDAFFELIRKSNPRSVEIVAARQFEYWRKRCVTREKPPKTLEDALIDAGCPAFAEAVSACMKHMALYGNF